jgi:hemerythrin-like domain-containing protein
MPPAKRSTKSTRSTTSTRKPRRSTAKRPAKQARRVTTRAETAANKATARAKAPSRARQAAKSATPARKRPRSASGPDAIALLKQDHREVEQLFKRFEKAGDRAHRAKRQILDSIIEELSRHAEVEELVFYPAVRAEVDDSESDVLEAIEEHHVAKVVLRELEDLDPTDERFDAKVTVMIENVRHHVKEEERELFPEVRDALERKRLVELGEQLRAAKRTVPTRPHPYAPDDLPGKALVGPAVAALDKARTAGKRAVDRVREEIPAP